MGRLFAIALCALSLAGCASPRSIGATVIDCKSDTIREVFRLDWDGVTAEDLTTAVIDVGRAQITENRYQFGFARGDSFVRFDINRFTGEGTREVVDKDGKLVIVEGSFKFAKCEPYKGKPL